MLSSLPMSTFRTLVPDVEGIAASPRIAGGSARLFQPPAPVSKTLTPRSTLSLCGAKAFLQIILMSALISSVC
jgi:hypothetical protein